MVQTLNFPRQVLKNISPEQGTFIQELLAELEAVHLTVFVIAISLKELPDAKLLKGIAVLCFFFCFVWVIPEAHTGVELLHIISLHYHQGRQVP